INTTTIDNREDNSNKYKISIDNSEDNKYNSSKYKISIDNSEDNSINTTTIDNNKYKISIENSEKLQNRTKELISELMDIIPGIGENVESEIKIKFIEDIGPQFIIFKTPTVKYTFKIIEFKSRKQMGVNKTIKREESQLVLSNFTTDLGLDIANFLMELFPINLESNQVINFTVHKDFIYFRMYRFCFKEKIIMENIGPHLTLRIWEIVEYKDNETISHNYKKYIKNRNLL
ncbi:MAG: hypothetical protein KC414_14690, partial [Romboutsia sp.]|nr:hypothetical protein [Romboutsia sp.]